MRIDASAFMLYALNMNTPNDKPLDGQDLLDDLVKKLHGADIRVSIARGWTAFMNAFSKAFERKIPDDKVLYRPKSKAVRRAVVDYYMAQIRYLAARIEAESAKEHWNLSKDVIMQALKANEPAFVADEGCYFNPYQMVVVRRNPGPCTLKLAVRAVKAALALVALPQEALRNTAQGQLPKEFTKDADEKLKPFLEGLAALLLENDTAALLARNVCEDWELASKMAGDAAVSQPLRYLAQASARLLRLKEEGLAEGD